MKKTIILLLCLSHFLIVAQTKNYRSDGRPIKVLGEKVLVSISDYNVDLDTPGESFGAAIGALLPSIIDLSSNIIKQKLTNNAERFTGEYGGKKSHEGFFDGKTKRNLPKITITRSVINDDHVKVDDVNKMVLVPELSKDKTAFRFKLDRAFVYKYSKAKVNKKFRYLDVEISITMRALTLKEGSYDLKELRTSTIKVSNVEVKSNNANLTDDYYSGWFPLFSPPTMKISKSMDSGSKLNVLEVKTVTTQEYCLDKDGERIKCMDKDGKKIKNSNQTKELLTSTMTRNAKTKVQKFQDTGLYEIEVKVSEINPYKIKANELKETFTGVEEKSLIVLKGILESFKSKDDSEEEEEESDGN